MRMAQFQTCISWYLLLGAGIVIMTLLGAVVSQVPPPSEAKAPPCNQEEDAFERRTLEDGASKILLNRQANFKADEIGEIGQAAADNVLNDLTPEKIAAQLKGAPVMDSLSTATNKARLASSTSSIRPYYHPTCPEVTIWLRPGYYYWRYVTDNDKTRTYTYCYNYWYISIIECACNYCRINYNPHSYYDRRYRCLEEYRYELVPVRCYSFTVNQQGQIVGKPQWGKIEYRHIRLPKDCCCHYYNYYYRDTLRKCAVPT